MNNIEIINNSGFNIPEETIIVFVQKVFLKLNITHWDLPISFVTSQEIQRLNKEYRNQDRPTDVITFNAYEEVGSEESTQTLNLSNFPDFPNFSATSDFSDTPIPETISPGDTVISLVEVEENSKENGVESSQELQRVLIHSILHLMGMTHQSYDFSSDPMLIKQEAILKEIAERDKTPWNIVKNLNKGI